MKYSIKKQLTMIYVGLIFGILIICVIANMALLQRFYIFNKVGSLTAIHSTLNEFMLSGSIGEDGSIEDEDIYTELLLLVENGNVSFLIQDTSGSVILTTNMDIDWLQYQLSAYQFDQNLSTFTQLVETEDYEVWKSVDPRTGTEYIEIWGYFDSGEAFIIRTPMESIQESVGVANRFFLYTGAILALFSIFLIRYFARKITGPVLELAAISTRMANLDFDAKYTGGGNNEIGILGASFNAMSYKLEQSISELKKVNNELLQDIENKEKLETMRTEFLSNVSHELKTPIALIQGYAEGLKDGISDDQESREFYCEVIMDEADKMNRMVKNLLELNQLEFSGNEVQIERFNVVEMLNGLVQSLDIIIQQKEVKVLLDVPKTAYVWGDQFKVEHVMRNYLTNALNHVDGDNVIHVKIKMKDKARISVFNTGTPIPEADVDRIWEKFYKVDKARTREYGGNGIGLSIVKAIMESLHQGYGVKNYDNGVEFWFELDTN